MLSEQSPQKNTIIPNWIVSAGRHRQGFPPHHVLDKQGMSSDASFFFKSACLWLGDANSISKTPAKLGSAAPVQGRSRSLTPGSGRAHRGNTAAAHWRLAETVRLTARGRRLRPPPVRNQTRFIATQTLVKKRSTSMAFIDTCPSFCLKAAKKRKLSPATYVNYIICTLAAESWVSCCARS